jgi:TolA-binding protein
MTTPLDDWDDEEREAFALLHDQLEGLRGRHASAPPLDLLAAARGGALPEDWQARVDAHLGGSAWSQTLVDGAELPEAPLDDLSHARLRAQVTRALDPAVRTRRRWFLPLLVGGALAASALLAVFTLRSADTPEAPSTREQASALPRAAPPATTPPFRLPLDTPEFRLSLGALTWRSETSEDGYLEALKPAVDAYRAGDHPAAAAAFDRVAAQYPNRPEALFYAGISRLHAGDAINAVDSFQAAARLGDEVFAADTTWYLAVAEQHAGDGEAARQRLGRQCAAGGPGAPRACSALEGWHDDTPPE